MTFKDGTIAVLLAVVLVGGMLAVSEYGNKRELQAKADATDSVITAERARADEWTTKAGERLERAIRADSRLIAETARADSLETALEDDVEDAVEISIEVGESIDEWLGTLKTVLVQLEAPHEAIEIIDSIGGAVDILESQVVTAAQAFAIQTTEFRDYRTTAIAFSDSAKVRFTVSDSVFAAKDSVISLQAGQIENYKDLANPGVLARMKRMLPFSSVESTINATITILVLILK